MFKKHIKFLLILTMGAQVHFFAYSNQAKEMKPTSKYCSKVTGLSQGFEEEIATKLRVSVSSVRFMRAYPDRLGGCDVTVDTPKGPITCSGLTVFTNGKDFWISGGCI